jgi:hypothetical protein
LYIEDELMLLLPARPAVLFSLVMLLFSPVCHADTIKYSAHAAPLADEARLVEFKDNSFVFLSKDGFLDALDAQKVTAFHSADTFLVQTVTSEVVSGVITIQDGNLTIASPVLGATSLPMKDVRYISRISRSISSSPGQLEKIAGLRAKGSPTKAGSAKGDEGKTVLAQESEIDAVPEDLYLRERKVMTRKGKFELETNLSFVNNDKSLPYLVTDKTRQLMLALTGRYGITEDFQTYLTLPVGVNWRESSQNGDRTKTRSDAGMGDVSFGLSYQLLAESVSFPALMISLSAKTDTGKSSGATTYGTNDLGSGYWTITPGLSMVRTLDPVVLFGGVSYTHAFSHMIQRPDWLESGPDSIRYEAGDSVNLLLGTGFSLNNKIALTFDVNGGFVFRDKFGGSEKGDNRTPFYFRSGLDYAFSKSCYLEPTVAFGITKDANDFSISLSHVFRFN